MVVDCVAEQSTLFISSSKKINQPRPVAGTWHRVHKIPLSTNLLSTIVDNDTVVIVNMLYTHTKALSRLWWCASFLRWTIAVRVHGMRSREA